MASTPDFKYAPMFQLGEDTTEYRLLSKEGVSTGEFEGKTILKVSKEALTLLAQQAFHDVEFMLRREQRGVSVGAQADQHPAQLVAVQWGHKCMDVVSTAKRYSLDISKVDNAIRGAALSPLGNLSFDPRLSADRSLRP